MNPPLSITYEKNETATYASNNSKGMCRNSASKKFSYIHYLLTCKFMRGMIFAVKIYKPSLPLVLCITRKADPLKIIDTIIGLNAVDVINSETCRVSGNKSHANKSMYCGAYTLSADFNSNFQISVIGFTYRKLFAFVNSSVNLPFPVSFSLARSGMACGKNSTIFSDEPLNAFCFNFNSTHYMYLHNEVGIVA
mgnify:CR=1 FL=1|tara:strand:- start:381 stop:962 length:582 start_codon:yes stop_codon:yes gene_type:complete